jgi:hypothetical protein
MLLSTLYQDNFHNGHKYIQIGNALLILDVCSVYPQEILKILNNLGKNIPMYISIILCIYSKFHEKINNHGLYQKKKLHGKAYFSSEFCH